MEFVNSLDRRLTRKIKPSPFSIRLAIKADINNLFPFNCELAGAKLDYLFLKKHYFKKLKNKEYTYLVAVDDLGKAIGYISCRQQIFLHQPGRVFEIEELFVDEEHRNNSVGKSLLHTLEKTLNITEQDALDITTQLKWGQAQSFFIKCGFELTHVKMRKRFCDETLAGKDGEPVNL